MNLETWKPDDVEAAILILQDLKKTTEGSSSERLLNAAKINIKKDIENKIKEILEKYIEREGVDKISNEIMRDVISPLLGFVM